MPTPKPAVVYLGESGRETAQRISGAIDGFLVGPDAGKSHEFKAGNQLRSLFLGGHPIVGVCAAGILVRSLAPVLDNKHLDPPVLCAAEDASSIVPLLGGHHGANQMAHVIAGKLNMHAFITTAGELSHGLALDSPPDGWRIESPELAKDTMAAVLSGKPITVSGCASWLEGLRNLPNVDWEDCHDRNSPVVVQAEGTVPLVYRRQKCIVGVGCSRSCPPDELIALTHMALADSGHSPHEVAAVCSVDLKSDEAAVHSLAENLGVPARFFSPERLEEETPKLSNPSESVFREVGCHGVSEGAALAAAGSDGCLVASKRKSANATCALAHIGSAQGSEGMQRGHLAIVGIGPGSLEQRTPEASRMIAQADELVGYGRYLDLVGAAASHKRKKLFELGQEELRCRYALERAGEGSRIALISSGDSGIYAMASLVMELVSRQRDAGGVSDAARRVEIECIPGISAMQAASARAGALLGHDFCAISLSDLLTSEDDIVRRVKAAADGDFVVALYNPVSKRRTALLSKVKTILLERRPSGTPVLLARNLGRDDERIVSRMLSGLETSEIDMMTVVLVGSSRSKAFRCGDIRAGAEGWRMFTPRGYSGKPTSRLPQ